MRHQVMAYDTIETGDLFVTIRRRGTACALVRVVDFISFVPLNFALSDSDRHRLNAIEEDYE